MKSLFIQTTACDGSDVFFTWLLWLIAAFILGFILAWLLKPCKCDDSSKGGAKQDLTKIEGIGPKIQDLLYAKNINSYSNLSNSSQDELESIIEDGGTAFYAHRHLALTWPAQAKLADQNQWEELAKWQGLLKGGV